MSEAKKTNKKPGETQRDTVHMLGRMAWKAKQWRNESEERKRAEILERIAKY